MGIFSRMSDIFKSNVNELIDRAENPEKMVKQIILDMQKELTKSVQALGKAVASERIAEKQFNESVRKSADWEAKAKAALATGNIDLAKRALAQKVKADEEVATYKEMYETISNQTEAIRTQVETLKAKLAEAKSRQAMLIARSQMAETKKNLAKSISSVDTASSYEKFNRMEEKIMQKEAEADAFAEMAGVAVSKESELFEQLQTDAKVDTELQRLMAEMGQLKTEKGEPTLEELIADAEAAAEAAVAESIE
ncbi:MAG: PspA/IM30 family protein [Oscillospiraceae bacterium]|nr:PspA/IM30 family protein [Oscillospiraceae bacterium]MDE6005019.1 PspA/IM30 family protein [Oscillospiraceae bacterium]